jgi:hypothetical protein
MNDSQRFELALRRQIDARFRRRPDPQNPFVRLLAGEMRLDECRSIFRNMLGSLLTFNQVLLPRLLRNAPTVECRVQLMEVIAQEYGVKGPRDAHPMLFVNFLQALGLEVSEAGMAEAVQTDAVRAEALYLRGLSFPQLLARILVGESLGPKVFAPIAAALRRSFNLTPKATLYFTLHAQHDKADAEVLFRMLAREARTAEQRAAAQAVIDESYSSGRYAMYGCALSDRIDYSFEEKLQTHGLVP